MITRRSWVVLRCALALALLLEMLCVLPGSPALTHAAAPAAIAAPIQATAPAARMEQTAPADQTIDLVTSDMLGGADWSSDIATGDLNADGILDIARSNSTGPIEIFLGVGNGTFGDPIVLSVGTSGSSLIRIADLDNDGSLDIVFVTLVGPKIVFGLGDGTFKSDIYDFGDIRKLYGDTNDPNVVNQSINSIEIGDINKDGFLDIVFGGFNSIFKNNGNSTFSLLDTLPENVQGTEKLKLLDLNNDQNLDILSTYNPRIDSIDFDVSIGLGNGYFKYFNTYNMHTSSLSIFDTGDVNNDGVIDIVTGNGQIANDRSLRVILGIGDGNFKKPIDISQNIQAEHTVRLSDLNGDGILDIAYNKLNSDFTFSIGIGIGTGNGLFENTRDLEIDGNIAGIADFNQDGTPDFVANEFDNNQILLNRDYSLFSEPIDLIFPPSAQINPASSVFSSTNEPEAQVIPIATLRKISSGDLNNDGILDIIASNPNQVLLGTKDGHFSIVNNHISLPENINGLVLADFNKDLFDDVVISYEHTINSNSSIISVYFGSEGGVFKGKSILSEEALRGSIISVGDTNGDENPDIIFQGKNQSIQVLHGNGKGIFNSPQNIKQSCRDIRDIHSAYLNKDNSSDIIIGCFQDKGITIMGDKNGKYSKKYTFTNPTGEISDIDIADINNDGSLDIILGDAGQIPIEGLSHITLGKGDGSFNEIIPLPLIQYSVNKIQYGDFNQDFIIDIITINIKGITILFGRGGGAFDRPINVLATNENNGSINNPLIADTDGDGVLDIIAISADGKLQLLRGLRSERFSQTSNAPPVQAAKQNRPFQPSSATEVSGIVPTIGLSFQQMLYDFLDRLFTQVSFPLHSDSSVTPTPSPPMKAVGLLDMTQAVDTALQRTRDLPTLLAQARITPRAQAGSSSATPATDAIIPTKALPKVQVFRPDLLPEAPDMYSSVILDTPVITIPYRLTVPPARRVRSIQGFYSLDGGGTWRTAKAVTPQATDPTTETTDLNRVFHWDVAAQGITGLHNNVLFRIVAVLYADKEPGRLLDPQRLRSASGTSTRFRLRGTHARVVTTTGAPVSDASVYRLPDKQIADAQLIPAPSNGNPQWYTDPQGYLKGHDPLTATDRLVALAPVSATTTYTLYHTSAPVSRDGLGLSRLTSTRVQTLTVAPEKPLVLFNLDLSVEWDARGDTGFRTQLDKQIKRASELLFRWSGGQAALGDINVFNNSQNWNTAHIRLYATNRMRPSATQGGIVEDRHPDPSNPELVYEPGQLRMGAVWNRYGEASAELGEEWARTLAHELGHYALFLNDNYLVKRDGRLITSGECPGPMTDPYDDSEGSFRPPADWLPTCTDTLSQLENKRDDWTTIKTFYTADNFALNEPSAFKPQDNPGLLPLAVTQVRFDADFDASDNLPLAGALVLLADSAGKPLRLGSRARGMLYQDGLMVDLGSPVEERLMARGTRRGDTVCVYAIDPVKSRQRHGCVAITSNNQQLRLLDSTSWQPDVRLSPVTTATLQLEVSVGGLAVGETLKAQLYTTEKNVLPEIALGRVGDTEVYTATLDTIQGTALEGLLRVWSTGMIRREVVVDLRVDGNPGAMWSRGAGRDSPGAMWSRGAGRSTPGAMWSRGTGRTSPGAMWSRGTGRTSPGAMWSRGAPLLSVDGQAILYTSQTKLDPGTMYLLQATDGAPAPPAWATPVSRAYRLSATAGASLAGSSLNINYLSQDVPFGQEQGVRLFAWDAGARQWRLLDTYLDQERNEASAMVSEEGLYMLMTATEVLRGGQGWNLNAFYPGITQPLAQATATISGSYSLIAGFEAGQADPWRIYDPALPAAWAPLVNDLSLLRAGERYWLHATAPISWFVRGPDKQRDQQSPPTPATSATARSLPPSLAAGAPGAQTGQRLILGSLPPAVFYGPAPAEGLAVEALVDGQLCDSTTTSLQTVGGVQRAVFVIRVRALGDGNTNCGVRGRAVRLVFGDGTQRDATWDNTRAQLVDAAVVAP